MRKTRYNNENDHFSTSHQPVVVMDTLPTGVVSEEEHRELQETMGLLQQELADLQVTASSNEATIRKLSELQFIISCKILLLV